MGLGTHVVGRYPGRYIRAIGIAGIQRLEEGSFQRRALELLLRAESAEGIGIGSTPVGNGEEGLEEQGKLVGRSAAADVHAVELHMRLHGNAICKEHILESAGSKAGHIIQGQKRSDVSSFALGESLYLRQASVQLKGIGEVA